MDIDLPLSSNGPAFRQTEQREGVPLDYVAEKLRVALESLHLHIRYEVGEMGDAAIDPATIIELPLILREAFHKVVVAFLALHNMLGSAGDHRLTDRLISKNADELALWIGAVEDGGSISGIQP